MPILVKNVPNKNRHITAEKIMSKKIQSLKCISTVKMVYEAIATSHHGFPITNMKGQVIGIIPKNFIIVILL